MRVPRCLLVAVLVLVAVGCGDDATGPRPPRTYTYELAPAVGGGGLRSVWRVGDVVYVTHARLNGSSTEGGIAYYRVTSDAQADGERVEPLGTLQLGGMILSLAGKGEVLYVGGRDGSWVIDVSDPLDPRSLGSRGLATATNGMRVDGDQLLLVQGSSLRIYDVSDPASPRQTHISSSNCWSGDVRDERFVMGQFPENRMLLYDVSVDDVFTDYPEATTEYGGAIQHARLVGEHLYVMEEFFDQQRAVLHVYSLLGLISGTGPREIQTIDFAGLRRGMDADDRFVATAGNGTVELFERGSDGRLTPYREFEAVGLGLSSGFPFYAFLGDGILYAPGESSVFVATF